MNEKIQHTLVIPETLADLRVDQAIAKLLPDYSRTQVQEWMKSNTVQVNGESVKPRMIVKGGETITINAELKLQPAWAAQPIDLDIIYEDEALLVINKPAGMVVHPAAGNPDNTLLNALLHHCPDLKNLPRAGIVHRLDKDTTGLLVIAKNSVAIKKLSSQLKTHSMSRIYQAIVLGTMISGGTVDAPIERHPLQRKRMAVMDTGKKAVTHYRVMERYRDYTRIKIELQTGRTHQIRVHMAHIHYPILGDPVYGKRLQLPKGATPELISVLRSFKRQALHASELHLTHPVTGKAMSWQAPLPKDMQELIAVLKATGSSIGFRQV